MALVPFKNLLRFLQKKCDKHLKIDKKDLSRVAKFVSHNGSHCVKQIWFSFGYACYAKARKSQPLQKCSFLECLNSQSILFLEEKALCLEFNATQFYYLYSELPKGPFLENTIKKNYILSFPCFCHYALCQRMLCGWVLFLFKMVMITINHQRAYFADVLQSSVCFYQEKSIVSTLHAVGGQGAKA